MVVVSVSVCVYVCVCKDSAAPAHTRAYTRTQARGPRRHARAPACHRHHIPRLVRRQAFHTQTKTTIGTTKICVSSSICSIPLSHRISRPRKRDMDMVKNTLQGRTNGHALSARIIVLVEDKRPLCQLSSKRFEDNWHSGLLSSTKHQLQERRSPAYRRVNHLRQPGVEPPGVDVL